MLQKTIRRAKLSRNHFNSSKEHNRYCHNAASCQPGASAIWAIIAEVDVRLLMDLYYAVSSKTV